LACACASGVAATFGTAFGGVLFSVELTSNVYNVSNLPRAFLTAVCAMMVVFNVDQSQASITGLHSWFVFSETHIRQSTDAFTYIDLTLVIIMGIICGGLGVLFVNIIEVIKSET